MLPEFIFFLEREREVNKWGNLSGHLAGVTKRLQAPYENVHLSGNHNSPGSAKGEDLQEQLPDRR